MEGVFNALAGEPYEPRGMLHSELALIIHTVKRLGIEVLIESGRARAQSTYILAKYLPDVEIHSVEMREDPDVAFGRQRVAGFSNVRLYEGSGAVEVPRLVAENAAKRVAVLCDGPKGAAAVAILEQCFAYPHVRAGFIHDMRRLDHGGPSPHRAEAIARLADHRFSDDPVFVALTSWMDVRVREAGGPVGPRYEEEFGSYGPTVGVFTNHLHPQAISNQNASPQEISP